MTPMRSNQLVRRSYISRKIQQAPLDFAEIHNQLGCINIHPHIIVSSCRLRNEWHRIKQEHQQDHIELTQHMLSVLQVSPQLWMKKNQTNQGINVRRPIPTRFIPTNSRG